MTYCILMTSYGLRLGRIASQTAKQIRILDWHGGDSFSSRISVLRKDELVATFEDLEFAKAQFAAAEEKLRAALRVKTKAVSEAKAAFDGAVAGILVEIKFAASEEATS